MRKIHTSNTRLATYVSSVYLSVSDQCKYALAVCMREQGDAYMCCWPILKANSQTLR